MAGAFFVGMAICGLHSNPGMWGNYVIIGLGGAAILGGLIYGAVNSVRAHLRTRISKTVEAAQQRYPEFIFPKDMWQEILDKILKFNSPINACKALIRMSSTCTFFYQLINNYSPTRENLENYRRASTVCLDQLPDTLNLPPQDIRDQAFLTDEMCNIDTHYVYFMEVAGHPRCALRWIKYIEGKNIPIIGGVDFLARHFFAALLQVNPNQGSAQTAIYSFVAVFYQLSRSNPHHWSCKLLLPEDEAKTDTEKIRRGLSPRNNKGNAVDWLYEVLRGKPGELKVEGSENLQINLFQPKK
ncbi:MAG: hypothetical protein JJU12_00785 [Chlamydiales bacterium]|nr:hypothetical protein [Chlamydiales bacterium]